MDSEVDGKVDLRGAKTHLLDFSGTRVESIEGAGLRVDGDLRLRRFKAQSGIHLCDAKIESDLDCRRSFFGTLVDKNAPEDRAHKYNKEQVSLWADRMRIGGRWLMMGRGEHCEYDNIGGIFARNARIDGVVIMEKLKICCSTIYGIRADLIEVAGTIYRAPRKMTRLA